MFMKSNEEKLRRKNLRIAIILSAAIPISAGGFPILAIFAFPTNSLVIFAFGSATRMFISTTIFLAGMILVIKTITKRSDNEKLEDGN